VVLHSGHVFTSSVDLLSVLVKTGIAEPDSISEDLDDWEASDHALAIRRRFRGSDSMLVTLRLATHATATNLAYAHI